MPDIVNLNKARKAKQRADREKQASENRAKFGRTKADKEREKKLADLAAKRLEGGKIEDKE